MMETHANQHALIWIYIYIKAHRKSKLPITSASQRWARLSKPRAWITGSLLSMQAYWYNHTKTKGICLRIVYMEQDENRTAIKIHTETDKIRSTPLSGFFLQTSLMEAAILMQIFLSDLNSVKPFGSNTP